MLTIWDDQAAHARHAGRRPKQLDADRPRPQNAHHVRVHNVKRNPQNQRQQAQNPSRQPSLRGVRLHLALQPEPLADHIRGLVQHLGQVAAALLLNHDRRGHDPQVLHRNPLDQVLDRRLQLKSVILFLKTDLEFAAHWVGHSRPTRPMAAIRLCPARSPLTIRSSASGNPSSNLPKRLLRLNSTKPYGPSPATSPTPRAGKPFQRRRSTK